MFKMENVTIIPYKEIKPKIAKSVFIASGVSIIGDVEIGENSNIWFNSVLRGDVNYIRIGVNTNIQDGSVVHVTTGGNPTIIGDHVTIGHKATLHACTIENYCLVGMGAIILDKAVIGENSLVGAGSVVPPGKIFPANSLILGSPAVVKRPLRPEEIEFNKKSAQHYVNVTQNYLGSCSNEN